MLNRVTVAGNLLVDYVKKIDSYPERGKLSSILGLSWGVGGCACNTAIALKRLDSALSVAALGRTGEDENGRYIREVLEREGVRADITADHALPTSFTDVMSDVQGERTFFHARGANAAFGPEDVPFERLDCDLLHAGYILLLDRMDAEDKAYGTALARTLARVRALGIKTSVDVASENSDRLSKLTGHSLPYCDYFIVNEAEAAEITGLPARDAGGQLQEENVRRILERLVDLGVRETAVIHAPEGGWALSRSAGYAFSPSVALPREHIKGHVGAGDAFCAGMLYGVCRDFPLRRALETAAGAAACCLTEANSTDGLRDLAGTLKMIEQWGL
ncbi:MAG: carbohydrate kinase family protein [Firmicutes bacterium]|nr:carbohydrate kinase family protein [Bacillota bacterium]